MNQSRGLPPGVSATRGIAFLQGGLGALTGLLLAFGGTAVATATGFSSPAAGGLVIALGVVVLAISGLVIWGAILLGRLSRGARLGLLVYEWLSIALGLVGLTHPGLGLLGLVLAGVAVYYLHFDARTRAAFGAGPEPEPQRSPRAYAEPPRGRSVGGSPTTPGDAPPSRPPDDR